MADEQPTEPGEEFDQFEGLTRKLLKVPKSEVDDLRGKESFMEPELKTKRPNQ